MGIKGVSDKRVLPRLSKIRTGVKKTAKSGKEYPKEVAYFVLDPVKAILDKEGNVIGTEPDEHIQKAIEVYGKQPTVLDVVFPVDDMALCADPYMKWWGGNVQKKKAMLNCIGDGEYASYQGQQQVPGMIPPNELPNVEIVSGKPANRICNRDACPQAVSGACKPNMNLRVVLPKVSMFGVFQIDTTSTQAMEAILSSIDVARNALAMQGITSLAGVPLKLYRERTPNKHGGVNYIMKIAVSETGLEEEKQKYLQRQPSTLALGSGRTTVEPILIDEPNFDLLPQSMHGMPQTGELEAPNPELPTANTAETWIEEADVVEKLNAYESLMGSKIPRPKILARARKCKNKSELVAFIDSKLAEGQPQPQA